MSALPQYIVLALMGLSLVAEYVLAGEPRRRFGPAWGTADAIIYGLLLYAGGFFTPLGWAP